MASRAAPCIAIAIGCPGRQREGDLNLEVSHILSHSGVRADQVAWPIRVPTREGRGGCGGGETCGVVWHGRREPWSVLSAPLFRGNEGVCTTIITTKTKRFHLLFGLDGQIRRHWRELTVSHAAVAILLWLLSSNHLSVNALTTASQMSKADDHFTENGSGSLDGC